MIPVLIHNLHRMWREKARIILIFILTAGAVAAALFFSSQPYRAGSIALIPQPEQSALTAPILDITVLEQTPPLSELVRNRYDAVVEQNTDGSYSITTLKSDDFRKELEQILAQPQAEHVASQQMRRPAATILGFVTMFIMMEGVTLMFLFSDDKEQKQLERIAVSPISFSGYLCAHGLFVFLCLYLPTFGLIALASLFPVCSIGLPLWHYAWLLALLCGFSVAFSLFLNALFRSSERASMTGSAVVVLTSVLAGSFYAFEKGNLLLENLIRFIPQKAFFTLVEGIEAGNSFAQTASVLLYLAAVIVAFVLIAFIKTRRDYTCGN